MFAVKKRIDFYDCDPAGILFFGRIFNLAHHAYELFLEENSGGKNYFADKNILLPITHTEADYKSPIKAGEVVTIELSVSILKSSSFELSYKITNNGTLCAEVKTVHVCINKSDWKKCELPEELGKRLGE